MKIGVLQTGLVAEELVGAYGEYDQVFADLIRLADPAAEIEGWRVVEGVFPPGVDAADGWIISGSKHGVYEDHDWIEPLKAFIREAASAGAPMIGVCFGHQIMAEALGGRAEKSEKGWGIGPHEYEVIARPGWMRDAPAQLNLPAIHQDQVTRPAPDATRIACSEFCENAAFVYGDPERPYGISIQPHPEFTAPFTRELIEARRDRAFPSALCDAAQNRLESTALDTAWAAGWFMDFLMMHKK
ncbi:MAG: type 1 glutamine amidotransferase [Pikeienuella sp.]